MEGCADAQPPVSSLDGFQCHGVQGELQAVLVEDGRLVVALRDGVGRLGRYGLEWMAFGGVLGIETTQTPSRLRSTTFSAPGPSR